MATRPMLVPSKKAPAMKLTVPPSTTVRVARREDNTGEVMLVLPAGAVIDVEVEQPPVVDPEPEVPGGGLKMPEMVVVRPINSSNYVQFRSWNDTGRYVRYINNVFLKSGEDIQFVHQGGSGDVNRPFNGSVYRLLCDGVEVSRVTVTPGSERSAFPKVDLSAVKDGWHMFDIASDAAGEDSHPFWMYVNNTGEFPVQEFAPAQTGSYSMNHSEGPIARMARLPMKIDPPEFKLRERVAVPFDRVTTYKEMFRRDLSPTIDGDAPYLRKLANGVTTGLNIHGYHWGPLTEKMPTQVLRDGPFGVATIVGPTHLQIGRRGGIYGTDAWRMWHMEVNGRVTTLVGWRSDDKNGGYELVGDWSAVPPDRRGLHEVWGMTWHPGSVSDQRPDTTRMLDRGDGQLEHPHLPAGPRAFLADSQNNRIVAVQFRPDAHGVPPVITEFITGLNDPWDCVARGNVLYVSERQAHRISMWDVDTGKHLGNLIENPDGGRIAQIGKNRKSGYLSGKTVADAQKANIVLPEGLYLMDDWLYFGSLSMCQVRRINLKTGVSEVRMQWEPSIKNVFAKVTVGDGSFGPRNTVFVCLWNVNSQGAPAIRLPDGNAWPVIRAGSYPGVYGGGGEYRGIGYSSACAVRDGRLVYGGADYGIAELTLAQPGDTTYDRKRLALGKEKYERGPYRQVHGIDGFGQWKTKLPWGVDADMDYYLQHLGHMP